MDGGRGRSQAKKKKDVKRYYARLDQRPLLFYRLSSSLHQHGPWTVRGDIPILCLPAGRTALLSASPLTATRGGKPECNQAHPWNCLAVQVQRAAVDLTVHPHEKKRGYRGIPKQLRPVEAENIDSRNRKCICKIMKGVCETPKS